MSYTMNEVLSYLKNNVCVAKFTKSDGTDRTMRCTLIPSYLPETYQGHGGLLQETERNNVSVWDLDLNAWRSFRLDSLKTFEISQTQHFKRLLVD